MTPRSRSLVVLLYGFVLLGMPGSALGVAWPSMADDFVRDLGDLGLVTLAIGLSYAAMSVSSGSLSKRFPAGGLMAVTAFLASLGLIGFAFADSWTLVLAAAIPVGLAGGALDSLGNSYVALNRGARAMGAIHAAFGFGSMLAPLAMTGLLAAGLAWRWGFALLALAELVLAVALWGIASLIRMPMEGKADRPKRFGRRRVLVLSVWVFFIYAGVEGSTGFWAFTLLTEGQGVDATLAGLAVTGHWAALFASRVLVSAYGDRLPLDATITASVIGITAGLALLWWNPATWVAVFGLVAAGFFNGPVFPFEILLTSRRFGEEFTPWAVGYQVAAATFAIAIIPALIGILVNVEGPLVIGAALTVLSVLMAASVETLRVVSARSEVGVASAHSDRG